MDENGMFMNVGDTSILSNYSTCRGTTLCSCCRPNKRTCDYQCEHFARVLCTCVFPFFEYLRVKSWYIMIYPDVSKLFRVKSFRLGAALDPTTSLAIILRSSLRLRQTLTLCLLEVFASTTRCDLVERLPESWNLCWPLQLTRPYSGVINHHVFRLCLWNVNLFLGWAWIPMAKGWIFWKHEIHHSQDLKLFQHGHLTWKRAYFTNSTGDGTNAMLAVLSCIILRSFGGSKGNWRDGHERHEKAINPTCPI